jgi:integrase
MARQIERLSALKVSRLKTPGYYGDGAGLWLQVSPSGSKSWIFRYTLAGKAREMGLGALHTFTLADARGKAAEQRKLLQAKIDPIDARNAKNAAEALVVVVPTFDSCVKSYIEAHRASWGNEKHVEQWESTLATYASPEFGALPVSEVDTAAVLRALEKDQFWTKKTETASRLRGRIEKVLDWAKGRGYRAGDNPAAWRGHLETMLPKPAKVKKVRHQPALPFERLHDFVRELRTVPGVGARALEFGILTAARSGEVRGAKWSEFDREKGVWTIPAERMKAKREHVVPLSLAALELLKALPTVKGCDFLFYNPRNHDPLSDATVGAVIKRMNEPIVQWTDKHGEPIVPHGFRSTFRDWCAERTAYPRDVAEMALAHTISDKVEAAYRRGDLFEKRRLMMADWAAFIELPPAPAKSNVVEMQFQTAA